jgi:pimeloyl-ACP methyl ester carboxylesterase
MPRVRVGQIDLHYEQWVDPAATASGGGRAEPLVLIMGLGAQLVMWPDGFCELLAARGYRVIAFDNRDAGMSTHLDAAPVPDVRRAMVRSLLGGRVDAPYTISDMADDAVGLLDALGLESAHFVGASMGGMIAQAAAISHPSRVRTLTSIMSSPGDRWSNLPRPRGLRALMMPPPRSEQQAIEGNLRFFRAVGSRAFDRDEAGIARRAARQFQRGVNPRGFARQLAAVLASDDRRTALAQLRMPALVVHGTIDPLIRVVAGRRTAAAIPDARLLEIEGMGHDLPPATWPRIVDAIAKLSKA